MKTFQCKLCQHFVQHYGFYGKGFTAIYCGHCTYPRLKHRKPDTLACVHFQKKTSET